MKFNVFRRYCIHIPALMIAIFLFFFVHSELGMFDYDRGNHSEHDHCEIVQVTNLQVAGFKVIQIKLEVNKYLSINFDLTDPLTSIIEPFAFQKNLNVETRSPLPHYIHHRSLLI